MLILFALMLLLSSIAINGLYNITRGRWEPKANGTLVWVGKIGNFWGKFLQTHTIHREYICGDPWKLEIFKLTAFFKPEEMIDIYDNAVVVKKMDKIRESLFSSFALVNDLKYTLKDFGTVGGQMISAYREVKDFKFPVIVRAPLGECVACMSSFWGTVMWLLWRQVAAQVQLVHPTYTVRSFLELPFATVLGLWVVFCISLAYLNETIFNINAKLSK